MAKGTNNGNGNGGVGTGGSVLATDLDDELNGGNGMDTIFGMAGNDTISGGNGKDKLHGDDGDDFLSGGNGKDMLWGDVGLDVLNGGIGKDVLTGGLDADTFVLDSNALKGGSDTITDFTETVTTTTTTTDPDTGETITTTTTVLGDVLELDGILHGFNPVNDLLADFVQLTESGGNTVVSIDANGAEGGAHFKPLVTLEGVTGLDAAELLASGNILVT